MSAVHKVHQLVKRVPAVDHLANFVLRSARDVFWSRRPYRNAEPIPQDYAQFVINNIGEDRFKMIEVGCGDGNVLRHIASLYPNASFIGIDLRKEAIAKGQADLATAGIKNIELYCASCLDDTIPWECDYLISRTSLIYLNVDQMCAFLTARLPNVRRKALLEEIISTTGAPELSHFYANPIPDLVRRASDQFDVTSTLLDYPPWKKEGRWSGADLVIARRGFAV